MWVKLFIFLIGNAGAVIYKLNDSDYALMPPLFHLDPYEECFLDPEALYCTVEFALVSDEPSELLTMIQEYSNHKTTHHNHTLLRHGICVTQTCKMFYEKSQGDLRSTLEACANDSLYNKYKLKARVSDGFDCSKQKKTEDVDWLDKSVAITCLVIVLVNISASLFDYIFVEGKDTGVLKFILCFSLIKNWKKLVASSAAGNEPRLQLLKGIHGMRVMTIFLVIGSHSFFCNVPLVENPEFFEGLYDSKAVKISFNATFLIQTFLVLSAFLLVYNWLIYSETHAPSWKMMPKLIIMRWLRLTPSYAIILALVATWCGRISSGPLWKAFVSTEMTDCRLYWWQNLLYINNYFDHSSCMAQTWYLAADTHLYYVAAIIFLACRTARSQKITLSVLFVAGLVMPAVHTYYQGLDGVLIISPEKMMNLFFDDPNFNELHRRSHNNLPGFMIGMALGYLVYHWQQTGVDFKKYQKYRVLYWMLVPLGALCCYPGSIFYEDQPLPPVYIKMLYAALLKPAFGMILALGIVGLLFQIEGLYRPILEWQGWTILSRLSYTAYLVHTIFLRNHIASLTATRIVNEVHYIKSVSVSILASFTAAFFIWMLVEAPFANLIKVCLNPKPATKVQGKKID